MLSAPLVHGAYRGGPSFEPGAALAMDFRRGRYRLGAGRGRLASSPSVLPTFVANGGAGFGYVKRNGVWVNVAANTPAISDEGLEAWDSSQNLNAQSGELTLENGWALSTGSPPVRTPGHFVDGLRATRFTTLSDVMAYRIYDETNAVWISPIGGNNVATPYPAGRVSISVIAPAGCTALRVYPLRSLDNSTWTYKTFAVTPGATYTARWLAAKAGNDYYIGAFGFRAGKELNDPPIQTAALAATRTAPDIRLQALNVPPTHYGVARARWMAPVGAGGSSFPVAFELGAESGPNDRVLWRRSEVAGNAALLFRSAGVNIATFDVGGTPGVWATVAWRCKAGSYAVSANGGATAVNNDARALPTLARLGLLGNAYSEGNPGNGQLSQIGIWHGDISNADLQALGARYTHA
jgi:hypothetical protein